MRANANRSRALARSFDYLLQRYLLRRRDLLAQIPQYGLRMRVCAADVVGRHLFKRGVHEAGLTRWLLDEVTVRDGKVALDIGANLGWYSLLLAKAFPKARIHAFEPEPRNFAFLQENLRLNEIGNVTAHELAVADQAGEQSFYPHGDKNLGRHSLLPINQLPPITVRTVRLDDQLDALGIAATDVDFVKIDVEGYELPALRGAPRLLEHCPLLLAEFAPKYMKQGGIEPGECARYLGDAGLVPFALADGELRELTTEQLATQQSRIDLIWRRRA